MTLGFLTDGCLADVAFAAQEGFECLEIELHGDTPLFLDASELRANLLEKKIAVAAVSLFGQDYFGPDSAASLTRLSKAVALGAALGAGAIVFGSGSHAPDPLAAAERLASAIGAAHEAGMGAAFYNGHGENIVDRPSAWYEVLPAVKGLGIQFDPAQPAALGRDWRAELLAAGPHLVHVHARDVLSVAGKVLAEPNPGLGDIDWSAFFGILHHVGYVGPVCIAPRGELYTGARRYDFLRLSAQFLRPLLA